MKKLLSISAILVIFVFVVAFSPASGTSKGSSHNTPAPAGPAFPDSVSKIIEKSCYPCHSEPGNGMAMMHLNFDKWDSYSPEKQADKAKAMAKKVSAGKMPTGSFKKNNPDKVPTDIEVATLNNWAKSFEKK